MSFYHDPYVNLDPPDDGPEPECAACGADFDPPVWDEFGDRSESDPAFTMCAECIENGVEPEPPSVTFARPDSGIWTPQATATADANWHLPPPFNADDDLPF